MKLLAFESSAGPASVCLAEDGKILISMSRNDGLTHSRTLLDMAGGRLPWDAIPSILASADRDRAGVTAPACGLYLQEVYY